MSNGELRCQPYENIHAIFFDGNFEASMLLLDSIWEQSLKNIAPNGFVAAVPARDILAFCDCKSEQGIQELNELVTRILNNPEADHPLTGKLLIRKDHQWSFDQHN